MAQAFLPDFFVPLLETQYGAEEAARICAGFCVKRKTTLRINTLKPVDVDTALAQAGIQTARVPFCPQARVLLSGDEQAVRALPLYAGGQVYLQSLSSMLPPIVLNPQPGDDILDMAAAPGGKTTQIAAMTDNRASITACERNPIRAEKLKYNLAHQGAARVNVMVQDARTLDDLFSFTRILLDAPCSGSGTLSASDPSLTRTFTRKLIEKCRQTQLALLKKALRALKPGGEMVYSTCSVLREENEDMIKEGMKGTKAEIVPITFEGLEALPLLPTILPGTLCVCPDENYEGFFVAKLRKGR